MVSFVYPGDKRRHYLTRRHHIVLDGWRPELHNGLEYCLSLFLIPYKDKYFDNGVLTGEHVFNIFIREDLRTLTHYSFIWSKPAIRQRVLCPVSRRPKPFFVLQVEFFWQSISCVVL